ncbi:OmpA family protein [Nibribacter ruber]|uniref:OmpA family protein n=1 Tax=Nibribacter ruber TaxID=2698458 RepID=A0A6P1NUS8_9BACT|nr:OmpA family protein [Nibribacter ruber]QHL86084.1 OmpA family protein [Nibribacter ruber]
MKKLPFLLACALSAHLATAQNVEFVKENFPQNKEGFKEAKKRLDEGNDIFAATSKKTDDAYRKKFYKDAIAPYLDAYAVNPNNAVLNYRLGVAYLFSDQKAKALPYLEKAKKLNPAIDPELSFYLARAYQMNLEWQKATTDYKKYLATLSTDKGRAKVDVVNKYIRECLSGEKLQKKPVRVFIDNAGEALNSKFADTQPVVSADETVLLFSSRREMMPDGKAQPEKPKVPHDDIYISTKVNGQWTAAKPLDSKINTDKNEQVVAISPDGQRFLFVSDENEGNVFECVLKGKEWDKPEGFGKEINSNGRESWATYSYDGKTIYFVSDRENGIGKGDIYFTTLDAKGNWSKPVNAGPKINTAYEEGSVFMMPDGKTLYFSSEGHNSMGGFDLFKSVLENGQWSEPENLGYPINTPDDDVFLSITANGRYGYMASNRLEKSQGESDLYRITFLGAEKHMVLSTEDDLIASTSLQVAQPVQLPALDLKTPQSILVEGAVLDAKTQKPLEATVEVIDNARKEVIATFTTNSATGKYLVSLPAGKNYGLAIRKDDYVFYSENFQLPAASTFRQVHQPVKLQPLEPGSTLAMQNIFFEEGKAILLPESTHELKALVALLNDKKSLRVEVAGLTLSKDAPQPLSESRAKAILDYLVANGINVKRLQAKGYAYGEPAAETPGTAKDVRLELRFLSK